MRSYLYVLQPLNIAQCTEKLMVANFGFLGWRFDRLCAKGTPVVIYLFILRLSLRSYWVPYSPNSSINNLLVFVSFHERNRCILFSVQRNPPWLPRAYGTRNGASGFSKIWIQLTDWKMRAVHLGRLPSEWEQLWNAWRMRGQVSQTPQTLCRVLTTFNALTYCN